MNKVLLVDDENLLLDSLEIILTLNDMEIIGKANDGNAALEILDKEGMGCDIALVDLNMKGMGGIELIGRSIHGQRSLCLPPFMMMNILQKQSPVARMDIS
jgi:YesN/AraC family two-component response regulator